MEIHFAPLQGYTDVIYRNAFQHYFGGINAYYTPFIRLEKGGQVRKKDLRDIDAAANSGAFVIPQILAGNAVEMEHLLELVESAGYRRADLNLGCPFPMVVKSGRGSGLLEYPDKVEELLQKAQAFSNVRLSVKIRLGLKSNIDALRLLPLFEKYGVSHIAVHARTTIQQYKGVPDRDGFRQIYQTTKLPLFYNGDLKSQEDLNEMKVSFPDIKGVMIGRGLLENPFLGTEFAGEILNRKEKSEVLLSFHNALLANYQERLSGDSHLLLKMKTLWDYLLPDMEKRDLRRIKKAKYVNAYRDAVDGGIQNWSEE